MMHWGRTLRKLRLSSMIMKLMRYFQWQNLWKCGRRGSTIRFFFFNKINISYCQEGVRHTPNPWPEVFFLGGFYKTNIGYCQEGHPRLNPWPGVYFIKPTSVTVRKV